MKHYTLFSGIATVMSFSRTHFSLISIIFTFQSPLPTLLAIITQDSERSFLIIIETFLEINLLIIEFSGISLFGFSAK